MRQTKGARGTKILTAHGEQAMGRLWAKQELKELCSWEQVLRMARQARRARLDQQPSVETRLPGLEKGEAICSLCMAGSCTRGEEEEEEEERRRVVLSF